MSQASARPGAMPQQRKRQVACGFALAAHDQQAGQAQAAPTSRRGLISSTRP